MTQNQLTELLESEGAKAMLETGEERGWIEPAELEAFALEHELVDTDVEDLTRELERIGLEVREARPEEKAPAQAPTRSSTRPTSLRARATASSCSLPTSGVTSFSLRRRRSSSPSASSAAT